MLLRTAPLVVDPDSSSAWPASVRRLVATCSFAHRPDSIVVVFVVGMETLVKGEDTCGTRKFSRDVQPHAGEGKEWLNMFAKTQTPAQLSMRGSVIYRHDQTTLSSHVMRRPVLQGGRYLSTQAANLGVQASGRELWSVFLMSTDSECWWAM